MSFVTPPTHAVGDVLGAADWNIVAGDLNAIWGGSWIPYTPSWTAASGGTNPTLGNGTLNGYYKLIGKLCAVHVFLSWGSTTSGGQGAWQFTLPVNPALNVEQSLNLRAVATGAANAPATLCGFMVIGAGSTIATPYLPQTVSSAVCYAAQNSDNAGTANTGVPLQTGGHIHPFETGSNMVITGTYETA